MITTGPLLFGYFGRDAGLSGQNERLMFLPTAPEVVVFLLTTSYEHLLFTEFSKF